MERGATIGENVLSQVRSRSHLSPSIIQAAPFNQNTVCFLSYTSCHCLKLWDSSLSSNACCDVYIALVLTQWNTRELRDIAICILHTLMYIVVGGLFRPWHHSWVTERGEAAVEALDDSLSGCPSRVLQLSCLVRFDQKQSFFAFIAYIF